MNVAQSRKAVGQLQLLAEVVRQHFRQMSRLQPLQQALHHATTRTRVQPLLIELLGAGINRRKSRSLPGVRLAHHLHLRMRNIQLPVEIIDTTIKNVLLTHNERLLEEVDATKPHQFDRPAAIPKDARKPQLAALTHLFEPPQYAPQLHPPTLGREIGNAVKLSLVNIPMRILQQQIAQRIYRQLLIEQLGLSGANPFEKFYGAI